MGLEIAKEAYIRGANVTLIVAHIEVNIPNVFNNVIFVDSSSQMNNKIKEIVKNFDIFISTAAVSDFKPITSGDFKFSSELPLSLAFKPTVKIIREIKKINPKIFLVGFKAEYNISEEQIVTCAKKQIDNAGTDLVVANDIGHSECKLGSDKNEVLLIDDNILKIPLSSKKEIAKIILDEVSKKRSL